MPYPKPKKRKKLRALLKDHHGKRLPFVVYRKPGAARIRAILQGDAALHTEWDLKHPGFFMAPFHQNGTPPVFIQADMSFSSPYKGALPRVDSADPKKDPVGREIHLDLVGRCIKTLKSGELKKVVVGRRFSVAAPGHVVDTFFDMIRFFPNAFGYLWYHPEAGTWMGATPERLLRYQSGWVETIALAGTKPVVTGQSDPGWTAKERKEQELVTEFILEQMHQIALQPETGPVRNVQAGKLWHLGTDIRAKTTRESALQLLKALHPTPAVCGIPREQASDFVRQNENFDREYYTGFLGEVGQEFDDGFEFFVNLRCMQVRSGRAYIYVGVA